MRPGQNACPLRAWQVPLLALLAVGLLPHRGFAEGTPAGTVLTNQASASFRYGGRTELLTVHSNLLSITVEQIAAVNLTPASDTRDGFVNTTIDYPVSITNSGNGVDRFSLGVSSSGGLAVVVYLDADGNGLLSASELASGPAAGTGDLAADAVVNLVLRLSIPDDLALVGQTDLVLCTAASAADPARSATALRSTTIRGTIVASTKSVHPSTPGAGDRVTYTITYSNTGNAAGTSLTVSDILDGTLAFVTGSAAPPPDSVAGQSMVWNVGTIPPGGNGTIVFQADIATNAIPGAEVHNIAGLLFIDGPHTRSTTSTEASFVTIRSGGPVTVDFVPDQTGAAEAGDTIAYRFVLTNTGILPEEFLLSYTSSEALQWVFYSDDNHDGKVDPGQTPVAGTGPLPGGEQYPLIARAVLPLVPADQTIDVTTLRARSSTNPDNFTAVTSTTLIGIPQISLDKTATAPDPRSGSDIVYTIVYTNTGHGQADSVVVIDDLPVDVAYVAGSLRLNGAPKTDASDDDEATVTGGSLSVYLGTLTPQASGVIEFRARIQ